MTTRGYFITNVTVPATINDMLNSSDYQSFISDRLGNDLFLSDPDRANRIYEAAEDGADGSTHGEVIDDWRAYTAILRDQADDEDEDPAIHTALDALDKEIDDCEQWHADHGTLDKQLD